jgi:hypothetical protein
MRIESVCGAPEVAWAKGAKKPPVLTEPAVEKESYEKRVDQARRRR